MCLLCTGLLHSLALQSGHLLAADKDDDDDTAADVDVVVAAAAAASVEDLNICILWKIAHRLQ